MLSAIEPSVYAGSCEYNTGCGTYARSLERIKQDKFVAGATNLEFTAWQQESNVYICGYRVTIDCFPTVSCQWGDPLEEKHHEVYVRASGATVPYDHYCEIDVEFWLKPKWNTVRKENLRWTRGVSESPGPPDHGWKVWGGVIMVFNDDATRSFAISGFEYHISIAYWPDLKAVPYDVSIPGDFTLLPREKKTFAAPVGDLTEGHTYFHFRMLDAPGGNVLSEEWADHEVFPYSVGGVWVTVDKLGLLAPYIGLASTIIVATVATAIYVKRVKRRNEK